MDFGENTTRSNGNTKEELVLKHSTQESSALKEINQKLGATAV